MPLSDETMKWLKENYPMEVDANFIGPPSYKGTVQGSKIRTVTINGKEYTLNFGPKVNSAEFKVPSSEGTGQSKVGDFTNLKGTDVDDILDRIPDDAVLRELRPVEGGATEGFEFRWTQDGQTYKVRVHNENPKSPIGSYSSEGWIVRVQRGKQYYDFTIEDFQPAKYTNPKGDFFDETIMNNTHIPIQDPYKK